MKHLYSFIKPIEKFVGTTPLCTLLTDQQTIFRVLLRFRCKLQSNQEILYQMTWEELYLEMVASNCQSCCSTKQDNQDTWHW